MKNPRRIRDEVYMVAQKHGFIYVPQRDIGRLQLDYHLNGRI